MGFFRDDYLKNQKYDVDTYGLAATYYFSNISTSWVNSLGVGANATHSQSDFGSDNTIGLSIGLFFRNYILDKPK